MGVGNTIRVFMVDTSDASNVRGIRSLKRTSKEYEMAEKTLILEAGPEDLGVTLDNMEGI